MQKNDNGYAFSMIECRKFIRNRVINLVFHREESVNTNDKSIDDLIPRNSCLSPN